MVDRPVILLTFANQQDSYLSKLKEESDTLNDILSALHDKQAIEVYREESASVDNVVKAINRFKDRIAIYHYAGHADGDHLHFEDGEGNAGGIAELLGQLPAIKLVFLNGCSTLKQVKKLHQSGIKAVVATAVPINDDKAVVFAEHFYRALAHNNDLESAFSFAVGVMRTKYGGDFKAPIFYGGEETAFDDTQKMPWGLYLNDPSGEILTWRLPSNFTATVSRPSSNNDYDVNHDLIEVLYAMADHDKKVEAIVYPGGEEAEIDDREALALIIENLPWPIGVQVRLLATRDETMTKASIPRLKQIVSTYIVASKFMLYIALSQIWDDRRSGILSKTVPFINVLNLSDHNYNTFDYLKTCIDALKLIQSSGNALYIKETEGLIEKFDSKSELHSAYLFLESIRSSIVKGDLDVLERDINQYCADGEYFLSTILYKIAFLARYELITIRDIHVVNHRHLDTKFYHYIGRLNAKVSDLAISRSPKPRPFIDYFNNASVVLTPDIQDPNQYLNLSPFLIDKNAFGHGMTEDRATEQQLFMYAFKTQEEYKYFTTIHNIYRIQERPETDQLSTSDGAISGDKTNEDERPRRSRRGRRNARRNRQENEDIPSPYAVLKQQFLVLEQDFIIQ